MLSYECNLYFETPQMYKLECEQHRTSNTSSDKTEAKDILKLALFYSNQKYTR